VLGVVELDYFYSISTPHSLELWRFAHRSTSPWKLYRWTLVESVLVVLLITLVIICEWEHVHVITADDMFLCECRVVKMLRVADCRR